MRSWTRRPSRAASTKESASASAHAHGRDRFSTPHRSVASWRRNCATRMCCTCMVCGMRRYGAPRPPHVMLAPAALAHDQWRKKLVYPVADRRIIRDAARLHATSHAEFDDLNRLPEPGRAVYVPNGVDLPFVPERDCRAARERFHLPATGPLVLFLGQIGRASCRE